MKQYPIFSDFQYASLSEALIEGVTDGFQIHAIWCDNQTV